MSLPHCANHQILIGFLYYLFFFSHKAIKILNLVLLHFPLLSSLLVHLNIYLYIYVLFFFGRHIEYASVARGSLSK